jgi:hypothetical protein
MSTKISQLTSATDITASDLMQIVDVEDGGMAVSGTNKRATAQLMANELGKLTNITATGSTAARLLANRFADVVNVKDFGAVGDCTGIGVGTNVIPSILAAVNYAINTIGNGARVVLPQGRYRASSSCLLNLQGKTGITIDLQGTITPDSIAATIVTIENGENVQINASIFEGGIFNGWLDPQPYGSCDYSTTRAAAAAGGQEFFLLRGMRNYTINFQANSYAGRLVRTDARSNPSHPHTQAIKGKITTERNAVDLSKPRVAQSLWADYGVGPNPGNWGSLERLVCDFDYYGPVWKGLNDIELSLVDSAFAKTGLSFYGCQTITGSVWFIGDVDAIGSNSHLLFGTDGGNACSFVNVCSIKFLNAGDGLVADSLFNATFTVHHSSPSVSMPFDTVVSLTNCKQINANIWAFGYGASLLSMSGASTENINASVDSYSTNLTSDSITISSDVGGFVYLKPKTNNVTSGTSSIKIENTALVLINDLYMNGIAGSFHFDVTNNSNQIYIQQGNVGGLATGYKTNAPRSVTEVSGLDSRSSFAFRSNEGGNAAGAGGSMSFGINQGGYQAHSPMAQIKGSLVNSTGTELQGNIKLQVRPSGIAGQTLVDGVVVSPTSTDNETYATLMTRISGSDVSKRIKVGAAGTGPSGAGRALFVDT